MILLRNRPFKKETVATLLNIEQVASGCELMVTLFP